MSRVINFFGWHARCVPPCLPADTVAVPVTYDARNISGLDYTTIMRNQHIPKYVVRSCVLVDPWMGGCVGRDRDRDRDRDGVIDR